MRALLRMGSHFLRLFLGALSASAGFGLLLGLAWRPAFSQSVEYKVITLLVVTALALVIGGAVSGLLAGSDRVRRGFALGLFSGLLAFGYIFGPNLVLLIMVPLAGLLAAGGGWLAARTAEAVARSR